MTRKPCCQSSRCETSMMLWEEPKAATSLAMVFSRASDHRTRAQLRDALRAVAQFLQDGFGVRALPGRGCERDLCAGMARELHRQPHDTDLAELRMLHRLRDAEVLHLRVVEHAVHRVDRAAGHAGAEQAVGPVR